MRAGSLSDARVIALLKKYFICVHMPELVTRELIRDPADVALLEKFNKQTGRALEGGEREVFFTSDGKLVDLFLSLNVGDKQYSLKTRLQPHTAVQRFFDAAAKAYRGTHGRLPDDWERLRDGTTPEVAAVRQLAVPPPKVQPSELTLAVWFRHDVIMYEELAGRELLRLSRQEGRSLLPSELVEGRHQEWPEELTLRLARLLYPRGGGVLIRVKDASIQARLQTRITRVAQGEVAGSFVGSFELKPTAELERGLREHYRPWLWTRGDLVGDFLWDMKAGQFRRFRLVTPNGEVKFAWKQYGKNGVHAFHVGMELLQPDMELGAGKGSGIKNQDFAQRLRSEKITFEAPADLPAELRERLVLAQSFFTSENRAAFLKALEKLDADEPIRIGWYDPKHQRFVGPSFSRTRSVLEKMTDQEFEEYRSTWNEHLERSECRYYCPGRKLREATKAELANMRLLRTSKTRDAFLKHVAPEGAAYAVIAHLEKVGTGVHHYAIPLGEVRGLSEEKFQSWRKRFLRWIEAHTPGQSRVTWMAELSDTDFDKELQGHRRKFRSVTFQYQKWQGPFFERWGLKIQQPEVDKAAAKLVVVTEVRDGALAATAGLRPGDQITSVEGQFLQEWQDLPFILESYQSKTKLNLGIVRDGKSQQLWIVVP